MELNHTGKNKGLSFVAFVTFVSEIHPEVHCPGLTNYSLG